MVGNEKAFLEEDLIKNESRKYASCLAAAIVITN
jgi:hypothetical protein